MKRSEIDEFEKLASQLDSLHSEMSVLSKKSPNDAVNPFKIKLINSTLDHCNGFLGEKYRPFADFDSFNVDDLPSNSDVTFILSQYIGCAEKLRADNIKDEFGIWYWIVKDGGLIKTAPPKKIRDK